MSRQLRSDLALIARWIKPNSAVLDLGCGDGALLAYLQEEKGCRCVGVELDPAGFIAALDNGVDWGTGRARGISFCCTCRTCRG